MHQLDRARLVYYGALIGDCFDLAATVIKLSLVSIIPDTKASGGSFPTPASCNATIGDLYKHHESILDPGDLKMFTRLSL